MRQTRIIFNIIKDVIFYKIEIKPTEVSFAGLIFNYQAKERFPYFTVHIYKVHCP